MGDVPVSMEFDSAWLAPSGVLDDRYEIQRVLGRGGAAIVLLARDRRYDRDVAIKVLKPELAGVVATERFLQEVRITASLQHPHILPLLDSGESRGLPYYVIPYVAGGSLRDRLDHARQLPVEEALAIAADIAAALSFAHERGILHRDIKPENILLSGDRAVVADFGLAQALARAGGDRLTSSGIVVGTPAYISPEQASGERTLGPPTDIYSLACVTYEMIAGVPPFVGPTAESVIAQRFRGPPLSLSQYRPTVPPALERAVSRALLTAPADRFRTAGEFARSLQDSLADGASRRSSKGILTQRPVWQRTAMIGSAVVLIAAVSAAIWARLGRASAVALDQSRIVSLPLTPMSSDSASERISSDATQQLNEAISQWSDLHLVNDRTTSEALAVQGRSPPTTRDALELARRLGAGRLLWGEVVGSHDSITVHASLYDVARGTISKEARISYSAHSSSLIQPFRELANKLLRDRDELPWTTQEQRWPASLAAWSAYDSARQALDSADVTAAEQRLRDALRIDAGFPQAELWLAQLLSWSTQSRSPEETRRAIDEERALTTRALNMADRLSASERAWGAGLKALAEGDYPGACTRFRALLTIVPNDFRGWYGLGDCLSKDATVVVSARSPSGYVFRTGLHSSVLAYEHALETLPTQPPDFIYIRLQKVLTTEPARGRVGRDASNKSSFFAMPILVNDTLGYYPYPAQMVSPRFVQLTSVNRAVQANVERLGRSLRSWVRLSPRNPLAHESLGGLLEKAGIITSGADDSMSATVQIRAARALTPDSLHKLQLSATLVRLAIKSDSFASAAALADSLVRATNNPTSARAEALVGLSALLGYGDRTTALLRPLMQFPRFGPVLPDGRPIAAPPPILSMAADGNVRAALGICDDSLRTFSSRLDTALTSYVPDPDTRATLRTAAELPVLSAAVPCLGASVVTGLPSQDLLVRLQQTYASSGRQALRASFDSLKVMRRGLRPGDVAINYTYQESWLLLTAGDTSEAASHLDRTLEALPTLSTQVLDFPMQAAALVRAMALRAELASKRKERAKAIRWANGVAALWAHADPELSKTVQRMRQIAANRA